MKQKSLIKRFIFIVLLTTIAGAIALPQNVPVQFSLLDRQVSSAIGSPRLDFTLFGKRYQKEFTLKQGLDIQGGMQVVLQADMSSIPPEDRQTAIESAREVILRRVDLYGIAEPTVQTAMQGDQYRLIVELPGVSDPQQALQLVGTTAQLEFQLLKETSPELLQASGSAEATSSPSVVTLEPTGITGQQLQRATVQFDPTTGEPVIGLAFNEEGRQLFADVTTNNVGEALGIFLDQGLLMAPVINVPILDGQAVITGGFTLEEAKQISIQLNAGALPVPISVLEQRTVGASLGKESIQKSVQAGMIGLGCVMAFMVVLYGIRGVFSVFSLLIYAVITAALYKIIGVTLTLPGIAGLLLSVGMAVDANILIFERMKEEIRAGRTKAQALELGFGRAWDSIKDANLATMMTALVLINPLNFSFLNTAGMVRGFGLTLLIGVLVGLFTGVFVTRVLLRLFLNTSEAPRKDTK